MTFPTLTTKTKAIIGTVTVATSFAAGRYSVDVAPVVHTAISKEIEKHIQTDTQTHAVTKIVEVKKPDGTDTKTTVITQEKNVEQAKTTQAQTKIDQTVTPPKKTNLNVSALIAADLSNFGKGPAYGVSVTKQVLGPVSVGAFALTNSVVGVSIGLEF